MLCLRLHSYYPIRLLSPYSFLVAVHFTVLFIYTKFTIPYKFFLPVPHPMEDVKKHIEAVKSKRSQNTAAHQNKPLTFPSTSSSEAFYAHATMAALEHLVHTDKENAMTTSRPTALSLIRQTRGLDKARKRCSFTPLLRVFQTGAQHGILLAHQSYRLPSGHAHGIKLFALPATVMGTSLGILDLY